MATVEVFDCKRRARTVAAIKYVRQLRGLGLAEAKCLIDQVYSGHRAIVLEFGSEAGAVDFVEQMGTMGFSCRFIVSREPGPS